MKIKFGSIVTDGRGKLGGQVYSRNAAGAYVRNKVTPSNPQTVQQSLLRSTLATFSSGWKSLTESERAAWIAATVNFAKTDVFGDEVTPTGKNLYTKLNTNLTLINGSTIDNPPTPVAVVEPASLSASIDVGIGNTLNINVGGLDTNQTYLVFATPALSPGINYVKNRLRLLTTMAGNESQPFDIQSVYNARFGVPPAGQKVAFKVVPVNTVTGQAGVGLTTRTIVAETT